MKPINGSGYTIVEMLIVLAVSAVTAVSAFAIIRGQQGKNEFRTSVRDFEVKLTDIANDVAKGYFPNMGSAYTCTVSPVGIAITNSPLTNEEQGSSQECVFAGKVVEFEPGTNPRQMRVITMAARRKARDNKNVTSLASLLDGDMRPVTVLDEPLNLLHGLRVQSVRAGASNPSSIAFLSGFTNRASTVGSITGAPETDVYWINNTAFGSATPVGPELAVIGNYQAPNATTGIDICLDTGGGAPSAIVTLGSDGRQLTTTTVIRPGLPC